jgi:general secretion pathway protein D
MIEIGLKEMTKHLKLKMMLSGLSVVLFTSSALAQKPKVAKVEIKAKGASSVPEGQELVNIDFPEPTEIKDIIRAVALWTGKNVILDRNVNGKVQIISPKKVTKEEAYQAFLSALNLLTLTTVETGKVIKIMPIRTAVKGNLKTFMGSSWTPMTDMIITQIVPLKYVDAKAIQRTLSRIVSSNSMIAYEPTNTLIISDSGYKVRRVLDILQLLDVQGQQPQVAIVPIKFADAKDISAKVGEIYKASSAAKGKKSTGSSYRTYKILTDERTNAVIIFGPPRTIADVKDLVKKFDVQLLDPSRQATIHVRPLDYADAKKLASTLSSLASGSKNSRSSRRPPVGKNKGKSGALPSVAQLDDNVKITADEASNALIITGSHSAYQAVNQIIRKLDMRRSQVFVETDILDINMTGGFQFGTSIFAGREGANETNVITAWQAAPMGPLVASQAAGTGTTSTSQLERVAGVFASDMTIGVISSKSINVAGLGAISPGALIKLIKTDDNTRVLSAPNILTSNNEEASIKVGETVYFKSLETKAASAAVVSKPEKVKVDLSLVIKPNISHSNYVTMSIDLESNSLAGIDAGSGLPRINTRSSKQIITVKNDQTVVISGLVKAQESESYKKIPLLGDIPIIGWLFRNSTIVNIKTNLMIFLTPHIIHGADDLAAVYKKKLKERDQFMATVYGSSYDDTEFYSMLPTMADGEYKADAQDVAEKARHDQMLEEMYRKNSNSELPNNNIDTTPSPVPGLPVGGSSGGSMPPASGDDG